MNKTLYIILFSWLSLGAMAQENTDKKLAIQYFKTEQYQKATGLFEDLYHSNPTDEYYQYLLECYTLQEDFKSAIKFIEKHIRKTANNPEIYSVDLGHMYLQNQNSKKAEESFNSALNAIKTNPNLVYGISKKFTSYGYNKEALKAFQIAESNNPNMVFHYQKALIYADLGDVENMYNAYLDMLDQSPNYFSTVQRMLQFTIQQDPKNEANNQLKKLLIERIQSSNNIQFNNLLVWILIQENNYAQAFIQLKALDKRLNRNQAEIFDLGQTAMRSQDWTTAKKCFDYIVKKGQISPFFEQALMANLFANQEILNANPSATATQYQDLLTEFDHVLNQVFYPEDLLSLKTAKAHILAFKLNQPQQATLLLKEALKNAPNNQLAAANCKIELGTILLSFGDSWEALLYYAQVDKAFPEAEIGQQARYNKAMIAFYQGDFDWAKAQFNVLKTSTTKFIANDAMRMSILISDNTFEDTDTTFSALKLFAKAKLLEVRQDLDSAQFILDRLSIAFPSHSLQDEVLFEKAQIFEKQNKIQPAIDAYLQVINNYGTDLLADESLFYLAKIYELRLMDKEKAMLYYQQLFSEHGDSLFASLARDAFRKLRGDELFN